MSYIQTPMICECGNEWVTTSGMINTNIIQPTIECSKCGKQGKNKYKLENSCEERGKMTIQEWCESINNWAEKKGWNKDLDVSVDSIGKQVTNMHSELSEAWEEIKDGHKVSEIYYAVAKDSLLSKPEGFGIELADCVIRIMHTCAFYGIDLEARIREKMMFNESRSYRHGDKKA